MKNESSTDPIKEIVLRSAGSGRDTQYSDMQLGQKTITGAKCIAKFLSIVVENEDGTQKTLSVSNIEHKYNNPKFIKKTMGNICKKSIRRSKAYHQCIDSQAKRRSGMSEGREP